MRLERWAQKKAPSEWAQRPERGACGLFLHVASGTRDGDVNRKKEERRKVEECQQEEWREGEGGKREEEGGEGGLSGRKKSPFTGCKTNETVKGLFCRGRRLSF